MTNQESQAQLSVLPDITKAHHHSHDAIAKANSHDPQKRLLPVTLLSGFLGAGKTTLLKHILHEQDRFKIAVIVNDMAPLNIDASIVEHQVTQRRPKLVKMQNGCICCTLREDLVEELARLAEKDDFDYVVIESTGISEPMQVAESFVMSELPQLVRLDTCVTVVDVPNFSRDLFEGKLFSERFPDEEDNCNDNSAETGEANAEEQQPTHVSILLMDQVEFANVILLNKLDLVSPEELLKVKRAVEKLNPKAKIIETTFSRVPDLGEILDTKLFNIIDAQASAGWLQSLQEAQAGTLQSELDEYGVSSFIYRRRKPFDAVKLHRLCLQEGGYFFNGTHHSIIRSKGFLWLAGPPDSISDVCYEWEQAGSVLKIWPSFVFFAALPKEQYKDLPAEIRERIENDFTGKYGDRRQELVFIGYKAMDEKKICQLLDDCLLSDEDFAKGEEHWGMMFKDTFPEEFMIPDPEEEEVEGEDGSSMEVVMGSSDEENADAEMRDADKDGRSKKRRRVGKE